MDWKIYYDDETIKTSDNYKWEKICNYGILIIMHYPKKGRPQIHMGQDYYLMRDNTVISFGLKDLHDHMAQGINKGAIKFGRWAPDDIWQRVHDKVFKDV